MAGVDVAPAIAHHKTAGEIDMVFALGLQQQTGLGLAASAMIRIVMITDEDIVDRQRSRERLMNALNGFASLAAARNIGLVGDDEQSESVRFQVEQR